MRLLFSGCGPAGTIQALTLLVVALGLVSCSGSKSGSSAADVVADTAEVPPGTIVPGEGLEFAIGSAKLGQPIDELETALGPPDKTYDFGPRGSAFDYSSLGFGGQLDADGRLVSLHVLEGFTGSTASGIGIGASRSLVEAELGPGRVDPFLEGAWYDQTGLGVEYEDDTVVRMHIFEVGL